MQGQKCMQSVANPEEKYYLKDLIIDGRIIRVLKWVLKKWNVGMWAGFIFLRVGFNNILLWMKMKTEVP